jgi:hypothetical protein
MYSCEFVEPDGEDCGDASVRSVSVRHGDCCDWREWPFCSVEHEDGLRRDLTGLFEVSASYPAGDPVARQAAERVAELGRAS